MSDTDSIQDMIDDYLGINPAKCRHPWRHTVYGSDDPSINGTTCVICGEKT